MQDNFLPKGLQISVLFGMMSQYIITNTNTIKLLYIIFFFAFPKYISL